MNNDNSNQLQPVNDNTSDAQRLLAASSRIKRFREARRMSLRVLGEKSGTSASFISQLERGLCGANASTLIRIADALSIRFSDLFEQVAPSLHRVLTPDKRPLLPTASGCRKMLLSQRPIHEIEVYIGEFEPGGSTGEQPYTHGQAHEMLLVLSGEIEHWLGDEHFYLKTGDCMEYSTATAHKTANTSQARAEVLWIIAPPTSAAAELDHYRPAL
ncbi:cupin [Ventosimonas gracilis]|uniref:Cupin n=1 Tax=Ventosimonas gracilis TaxID=1680762 RepID=A0A139SRT3_9GAMM|nr:XRE family transcriptional regulator [Ventosimonas gracilis]KXU37242.1 cupin [Ventosimonas gracilis]